MSKSAKMIIGAVAAIAVPFTAPALFAMMAGSSVLGGALATAAGAVGSTVGSGIIGAGLGAASSAITGGDIGRGAIFGALGGGLGSVAKTAQAANIAKAAQAAQGAGGAAPAAGMGIAPLASAAPVGTGTVLAPEAAGLSSGYGGATAGLQGLGSPAGSPVGTNTVLQGVQAPAPAAPMAAPAPSSSFDTGNYLATINATPGLSSSTLPPTWGQQFMTSLKAPFTGENAANTALSGAKYAVGALAGGSGMDPAQERLLQQQRHQQRLADAMNAQVFNTRNEAGLKSIREADFNDPDYMGRQRAAQEQLRGSRLKQAGVRGLNTAQAQAEGRRFDLGTSRNVGTAYDQGYQNAYGARLQARAAGVSMLPGTYVTDAGNYGSMQAAYNYADDRRRRDQADIGRLFGNLSGNNKKYQTDDPANG